jgi:hypothetical protein
VVLLLVKTASADPLHADPLNQEWQVLVFADESANIPAQVPHSNENRLGTFTVPVAPQSSYEVFDELNQAGSRGFEIYQSGTDWFLRGNIWSGRASEGKGFYYSRLRVQAMHKVASGSLIQSTFGKQGNYELVVPLGDHLAHYWRDNDSPDFPWHGPVRLPSLPAPDGVLQPLVPGGRFLGVTLIQSTIGPGNLDLVARATRGSDDESSLFFYGRDAAGWHGPQELQADGQPVTGVTG